MRTIVSRATLASSSKAAARSPATAATALPITSEGFRGAGRPAAAAGAALTTSETVATAAATETGGLAATATVATGVVISVGEGTGMSPEVSGAALACATGDSETCVPAATEACASAGKALVMASSRRGARASAVAADADAAGGICSLKLTEPPVIPIAARDVSRRAAPETELRM